MRGAYALGVLTEHEPDKLVAVRLANPLIIGLGKGENFISSDISAVLEYTRDIYILEDGEMAVLNKNGGPFSRWKRANGSCGIPFRWTGIWSRQ